MTAEPLTIIACKPLGSGTRFRLEIAGRERPLDVSDELVHRHRLKAGIVLTPPQLAQLENEAAYVDADRMVARMLGIREHSVGQVKAKLAQQQFCPQVINDTVRKYSSRGLLDDAQFAHNQARHFLDRNPSGRSFLVAWLRRKHISHDLAETTASMLLQDQDEVALAVASLRRKWNSLKQFDLERARTKAYTYLSRRGIGYSAAKAAFEQLCRQNDEADGH